MSNTKLLLTTHFNIYYNEATSSLTPNSCVVVFVFKGSVAVEDDVEKPNNATFPIFFINIIGFNLAHISTNAAYPNTKNINKVHTVVITYIYYFNI